MSARLTLAAVGLGAVAALLPAAPAAAVCQIHLPDGSCANVCTIVGIPYGLADAALHDKLPDLECPA